MQLLKVLNLLAGFIEPVIQKFNRQVSIQIMLELTCHVDANMFNFW